MVDCSVTMAWAFSDEGSQYTDHVLETLRKGEAFVPVHWPLEVVNTLLVAERRKRVKEHETQKAIQFLSEMAFRIDEGSITRAHTDVLEIARRYRLSSYDAAYVELAVRRQLKLATIDKEVERTARTLGIMFEVDTP